MAKPFPTTPLQFQRMFPDERVCGDYSVLSIGTRVPGPTYDALYSKRSIKYALPCPIAC